MEHLHDPVRFLNECRRILKPGGRIVIQEPDIRTFVVKLIAVAEKLALMRSHFLFPQAIADLFVFDEADIELHSEEFSAWIVIKKIPR